MGMYLRCVFANKVTLLGYIILFSAVAKICALHFGADDHPVSDFEVPLLMSFSSFLFLVSSMFGFGSLLEYKRGLRLLRARKMPDYVHKKYMSAHYCTRVGYLLALQEHTATVMQRYNNMQRYNKAAR